MHPHAHLHQHQLPAELNPQFLAGLFSGQQILAAAAAANDPNYQTHAHNPGHPYDEIIQGAPAPTTASAPESGSGSDQAHLDHITIIDDEEGAERPTKRRAVSAGSEIVSVPVASSGAEQSAPKQSKSTPSREQGEDNETTTQT
jgi:hypothetical protein